MGFLDWLRGKQKEEEKDDTRAKRLEKLGWFVSRSDELEKRTDQIEDLHNIVKTRMEDKELLEKVTLSHEDKINELWKKAYQIDIIIRKVAVPYGRGGENAWFREAMLGWEELHAYGVIMIKSVKQILEKGTDLQFINKDDLITNLEDFLVMEIWLYALFITDVTYFERDVSPAYLITLEQQIQKGYGPVTQPASMQFPKG